MIPLRQKPWPFYFAAVLMSTHSDSNFSDARAAPRQKYISGYVLGWTRNIHSYILPSLPRFSRGSAKFGRDFWPKSLLTSWSIGNLTHPPGPPMVNYFKVRFDFNTSPIPPQILQVCKIRPKFGFWGDVVSKRSNVSRTWNPHWERQWLVYHSPSLRTEGYKIVPSKRATRMCYITRPCTTNISEVQLRLNLKL